MNDGLKEKHRETIIRILSANPRLKRAVLFGSRAMGTHAAASDVDIALFGEELTLDDQAKLAAEIEKRPIPQSVDLLRFHVIEDKKLLKHIEKYGQEWYRREGKCAPSDRGRREARWYDGWTLRAFTEAVMVNPSVTLSTGNIYPFVEMAAVDPTARSVHESDHREFTGGGSRFISGDTLMARITPCLENGKIARFQPTDKTSPGFGSTEFIVIRGRKDVTDNDFAYYLTKWCKFHQFAVAQMTGTPGRQRVPSASLSGFIVAIPPLDIQVNIASILGTLDDKIELNRQMNRTLEKMAAATFKSWFVDFDPVRAKAEGRDTNLPADIANLFPDSFEESEHGAIPKGWKIGFLDNVADNPRRSVKPSDIPSTTPYIGLEHMPRRCIALDAWGRAEEVASGKSLFKQGEILFGKLRPYFHKVGIAPVDGVCSADIVVITLKSNDWHGYVISPVSSRPFVDYADSCSAGTKMPRTNWKDMIRYSLALPPKRLAKAFQDNVAAFHKRIGVNIRQNRRLASLRDTLLPKLLSGEIELPAVETVAEDTA
ncbi:MAG: restriction endonuclease subunit S [Planctomycetota bacterium]|jgi:type I restriction enzyme S subunit|nr:restriction endonuclease subunit S [Planctomycetota bacterium]